jgi:Mg2+/Co2+ transporter CorC
LIEELVGEISDEYDTEVVRSTSWGKIAIGWLLNTPWMTWPIFTTSISMMTMSTRWEGLLTKYVGRLPEAGSRAELEDLILVAEKPDGRRQRVSWIR